MNDKFFNKYAGASDEKFRLLPGYEEYYVVSSKGYVISMRTDKILEPNLHNGYPAIFVYKKNDLDKKKIPIHFLIANTFLIKPKTTKKIIVEHINDTRTDNRLENLKYSTGSLNGISAHINNKNMGMGGKRALKPVYQLDENSNIIKEFASVNDAAKSLNICPSSISDCCHGRKIYVGGFKWKLKVIEIKLLPGEVFKPIKPINDFTFPNIEVSNYGRFRNTKTNRLLAIIKNGNPYYQIILYNQNKKRCTYSVHTIVALNFLPEHLPGKTYVNHIDEDKHNNYYKNLQWLTPRENTVYSTGKAVNQIDLKTGKVIKTYDSIRAATRAMGSKHNSCISAVCNGKRPSMYGYGWQLINVIEV